jgi:hypothetical protein
VYWYALYPFHRFVSRGMLRGIARDAERRHGLERGSRVLGPKKKAPFRGLTDER